jgi:predicted amidohydrolase
VDPWGRVLADLETKEDIKTVELSREAIEKVRRQIPMKAHRRPGRV